MVFKKNLFFSSFFTILMAFCGCSVSSADQAWHTVFDAYPQKSIIKTLRYNPQITKYEPLYDTVTHESESRVTVYCHGYGESQASIPYLQKMGILSGTIIGFNFESAVEQGMPPLGKTSLGQTKDIASLCLVLKCIHESGVNIIDLSGFSAGAATIANTLARLAQPSYYPKFFKKLNITNAEATSILNKCLKGIVTLLCPLIDARIITVSKTFGFLMNWTISLAGGSYNPKGDQAIKAAPVLEALNPNIIIAFQKNDPVLGNEKDIPFCQKISGKNTYIIMGETPGSHTIDYKMAHTIQAHRKKCGAPYNATDEVLEAGAAILTKAQPATHALADYMKIC